MKILILIIVTPIILSIIEVVIQRSKIKKKQKENTYNENDCLPYEKTYLLTKNELQFYKNLKPITDELGFVILSKIRLADLIKVNSNDKKVRQKYFNKINSKHIDFALAKPNNLEIVLLIELDDNSHDYEQRERDIFINKLYDKTGYKLLRVRGSGNLKEKIEEIIKPKVEETETIVK